MDLHHQFELAAPAARAWPVFLDMPRIAPCLPGTEVTEAIDDRNVKGMARVKVGPVSLKFAGRAEMTQIDDTNRSAILSAKGSDAKGRGTAEADVRFSLAETGHGRTLVEVHTTLNLTGSIAQYGRASGLIDEIANQMIGEFVRCLESELGRDDMPAPDGGGDDSASAISASAPSSEPVSGITVFLKALMAVVKKWFGRS